MNLLPKSIVHQYKNCILTVHPALLPHFGGKGFYVTESSELQGTLEKAIAMDEPTIVNIMIDPKAQRKPQKFAWLTR